MAASIDFKAHRPPQASGRGDSHLPRLIKELRRLLAQTQKEFARDSLRLPARDLAGLAHLLVEFGEDIHNDIGIWQALEQYQRDFFGTPLPLTLLPDAPADPPALVDRLHHLLWVLYPQLVPDLILSPHHQDLRALARAAADFLEERLARVPRHSGVKDFLAQPNRFGWQVKRKLIWLGQHAYLFRSHCDNYVDANGGVADIGTLDDFLCQETTSWAGLGVIDILAALLPIPEAQRQEVRSWYERHLAYYEIKGASRGRLKVLNLINNQLYRVRVDQGGPPFERGHVVFGALVPWQGEWYWSGEQRLWQAVPAAVKKKLPADMHSQTPHIVYRYDAARANRARETVQRLADNFTSYHGDNLAVYADGRSMASDMQKMLQSYNESLPEADQAEARQKYKLDSTAPPSSFPPDLVESKDGVAVFFNPDEGQEIFIHFDVLVSALQKQGEDLSEDEGYAVQGLIESDNLSPNFVHRLLQDYDDASIAATYLIRQPPAYYLEYLLRRYKGHFYRQRYPQVTLVP